jgi:GIY-YIG catalytic domain
MPRKPIDYSKSLVYRIAYKDITYYVGSTTNFRNRKNQHKNNCKNVKAEEYNKALYVFIRENGGWSDDWVMVLIQFYPDCKTSLELLKYEREHYDIYKPELNVSKPYLYEGEREEYQKEYQKENVEKIKEKSIQYYTENAEKLKEQQKQYYKENAEKLNEKCKYKCGGKFAKKNESSHKKTQRHINYLNNVSTNIING